MFSGGTLGLELGALRHQTTWENLVFVFVFVLLNLKMPRVRIFEEKVRAWGGGKGDLSLGSQMFVH